MLRERACTVQLCGDAHLSNFGAFAAPDRRLVFSINDFDETHPGPFEWDVKRLAASFAVAGRDRGFDDKQRQAVNLAVGRSYREAMSKYAGMRNLDLWYARIDVEDLLGELGPVRHGEGTQAGRQEPRQDEDQGQSEGVLEADRDRRRRGCGSSATRRS